MRRTSLAASRKADVERTPAADLKRIDTTRDHEIQYWCNECAVTAAELLDAINRVGPRLRDVARALGKGA